MFRWIVLIILLGALLISGYHRRRARQAGGQIQRRQEGLALLAGRLLVAIPLFGGTFLYGVYPPAMAWASLQVPEWLRWIGVGLGLLTLPAVYWVLDALGTNVSETVLTKDQQKLVMQGPYRWIRHPLYTTGVALFFGLGLMAANAFILLFAFLAAILIRLVVVPLEERELIARFGSEYRKYRRRTGALLPRFRTGN